MTDAEKLQALETANAKPGEPENLLTHLASLVVKLSARLDDAETRIATLEKP